MVAYTVNYEDEQGNKLAESQTFYGNVGDKPVVAYRYIEDYVPQALSLTKTLSDNEAENVFTFKYAPGATESCCGDSQPRHSRNSGQYHREHRDHSGRNHWYRRWKRNRGQWNKQVRVRMELPEQTEPEQMEPEQMQTVRQLRVEQMPTADRMQTRMSTVENPDEQNTAGSKKPDLDDIEGVHRPVISMPERKLRKRIRLWV